MKLRSTIPAGCVVLMVLASHGSGQVDGVVPGGVLPARDARALNGYDTSGTPRPEVLGRSRARELESALDLTTVQTHQIANIITQETADCQALGPAPWPPAHPIRQRARDQIRALLTPEQRAKFNLIPEKMGGGLTGLSPWEQLDKLDKLVHLAPGQKKPVLDELIDRTENLMENQAPEQASKAQEIRLVISAEIRALLTPEQQKILDTAEAKHREQSGG